MPGQAEARILVHLEADSVAEGELEALVRVLARPGPLGALPGGLEDVADERVQLACRSRRAAPPPARARVAARTRTSCARTVSGTSPTTNVRVMSAQQPDASSRGQRSITIGRLAGSGPEPGSCPFPCHTEETMMSGGAGAPCCRQASRSAAHRLGRQHLAVEHQPLAIGHGLRSSAAAALIPASAAACALRMPASSAADLTRRRAATASWSGFSSTPSARSRSATATGISGSAIASRRPIAAAAREVSSSSSS